MLHGKRQNPVVNGATGYRSAVPTTAPRPLAQLLVDSVRRFGCDPLTPGLGVTADAVAAAAALHRVTPAVAGHLAEIVGPSAGWAAKLAPARHAQLIRHLTAKSDLRTVASALEGVGAPWVTVKGPTLADRVWPRPDMREYYDLDVVVDRRGFGHALRALEDAGCVLVDRNWPLLRSTMRAELAMRGPLGTPIDLHWDIAVPKDLRRDFSTDVDRLLARSVPVELGGGVAARTLDPVDTLFHLAFHAAQAGANRLVWLGDLWFAASVPGLDGAELARRTEAAGASLPVALVLRRTEDVLGHLGHVPDSLRAAADTAWGRLVRARDGRTRFPGLPGDPHLGGALYAGARRGVASSLVATTRIRHTVWRDERRHASGEGSPHPLRLDVPDVRARRAYLREVEGGAPSTAGIGNRRSPVRHAPRGYAD